MTLHAAIEKLLKFKGKPMSIQEIADELNAKGWYQRKDGTKLQGVHIHGRTRNYKDIFIRKGTTVSLFGELNNELPKPATSVKTAKAKSGKPTASAKTPAVKPAKATASAKAPVAKPAKATASAKAPATKPTKTAASAKTPAAKSTKTLGLEKSPFIKPVKTTKGKK